MESEITRREMRVSKLKLCKHEERTWDGLDGTMITHVNLRMIGCRSYLSYEGKAMGHVSRRPE
jgi:hypothetical protein